MKKMRILLIALLIVALTVIMAGCYQISGQKMNKLIGTYKLTNYTYTPSYERKAGYTAKTRDYVNGEEYLYEDYLIITGSSIGYYVHKAVDTPAYVKEVMLSYEYSEKDSSKIEYITYSDAFTAETSVNNGNHLGVSDNVLNFSRPAFDYTQLITNKAMRSDDLYVRWEKVDNATDLSYVREQFGTLKEYAYQSYAARGVYELSLDLTTGDVQFPYQYFFYVIDTAKGVNTVTACYALKETPTEQVKETVALLCDGTDWSTMTIDGIQWTVDQAVRSFYYSVRDGQRYKLTRISWDISDEAVDSYVGSRLAIEE